MRGGRGAGLDALSAMTTKRRVRGPLHHASHGPPPPLRGGGQSNPVLAARLCARGLPQALTNNSPERKREVQRREAPKSWPRHAGECCHSLALQARRAPQDNPLARTACFGRAAPPGAPPRFRRPAGRPASAQKPHSLHPPAQVCRRCPSERDFDSRYVAKIGTDVKCSHVYCDSRFPCATQHAVVRCRPGIAESSEHGRVEPPKTPDQRCTAARCTASGQRLRYHPRSGARFTAPSNKPPISFSASAARASLQPPCLALSRNLSSMSARVSGSCAPPRI